MAKTSIHSLRNSCSSASFYKRSEATLITNSYAQYASVASPLWRVVNPTLTGTNASPTSRLIAAALIKATPGTMIIVAISTAALSNPPTSHSKYFRPGLVNSSIGESNSDDSHYDKNGELHYDVSKNLDTLISKP
jgi:hypothetical protein